MSRGLAACLLVACFGCGRERPDPRLAEVTSPLHVTVRVIDAPVKRTCTGGMVEQFQCLTARAVRQGCVYVEVGSAADTPERNKAPDPTRCNGMYRLTQRATLVNEPGRKATLHVEPSGDRVVIDLGDSVHGLYLRKGLMVIRLRLWDGPLTQPRGLTRSDGTLDWSLVPPFLAVLDDEQLIALTEEELDALIASTPGGAAALKTSMMALTDSAGEDEGWGRAMARLAPADRSELRDAMLASVAGGNEPPLIWFIAHPDQQGPDFLAALEQGLEQSAFELSTALPVLRKLDPTRAEAIACQRLEQTWHETTSAGYDSYGEVPLDATTLAVLVDLRSKCPWVVPLLERSPCSWELRCDPDAEDDKQTPLCTAAQSAEILRKTLSPTESDDEEEDWVRESDWGALLVAAALIQGPLSPGFVLADARRQYSVTYTFKGHEDDDPCRQIMEDTPDWACRLPPSISSSTREGCRMVLDDVTKKMTLTPVTKAP